MNLSHILSLTLFEVSWKAGGAGFLLFLLIIGGIYYYKATEEDQYLSSFIGRNVDTVEVWDRKPRRWSDEWTANKLNAEYNTNIKASAPIAVYACPYRGVRLHFTPVGKMLLLITEDNGIIKEVIIGRP